MSWVDLLTAEVGEGVEPIASCLDPSDLQMHKTCADLMDGSVRLVMVVIKGDVAGDCGTNGGSFRPQKSLHGKGKKLRWSEDPYWR